MWELLNELLGELRRKWRKNVVKVRMRPRLMRVIGLHVVGGGLVWESSCWVQVEHCGLVD